MYETRGGLSCTQNKDTLKLMVLLISSSDVEMEVVIYSPSVHLVSQDCLCQPANDAYIRVTLVSKRKMKSSAYEMKYTLIS